MALSAVIIGVTGGAGIGMLCAERVRLLSDEERSQFLARWLPWLPQPYLDASPKTPEPRANGQWGGRNAGAASDERNPGRRGGGRPRGMEEDDDDELEPSFQGFSMEEARNHADNAQLKTMARTPGQVLADLQRGNTRFWMNVAARPEKSAFQRRGLISKQFPSVAILGCSDSRVPTEIVFDQGLGDIFVVRVAGNCLGTGTLASLQYAVHHLKVKVLMVLGHEMCGAVKAALLKNEQLEQEPNELEKALKGIKHGLDESRLKFIQDTRVLDRECVTTNVKCQVEQLMRDQGIRGKVDNRELIVIGAFYEISSGIVDFFKDADAGLSPKTRFAITGQSPSAARSASASFRMGAQE